VLGGVPDPDSGALLTPGLLLPRRAAGRPPAFVSWRWTASALACSYLSTGRTTRLPPSRRPFPPSTPPGRLAAPLPGASVSTGARGAVLRAPRRLTAERIESAPRDR